LDRRRTADLIGRRGSMYRSIQTAYRRPDVADSAVYDTLLVAEAAIDQAREENQTRPFSAEAKESLNRLIQAYNVAREAWLTYRGAVDAQRKRDSAAASSRRFFGSYFEQLNRNLSDLRRLSKDSRKSARS